jgi:hypothetical protein
MWLHVRNETAHYNEVHHEIFDIDMDMWKTARNVLKPIRFHLFHRRRNWVAYMQWGYISLVDSLTLLPCFRRLCFHVFDCLIVFNPLAGTDWAQQARLLVARSFDWLGPRHWSPPSHPFFACQEMFDAISSQNQISQNQISQSITIEENYQFTSVTEKADECQDNG